MLQRLWGYDDEGREELAKESSRARGKLLKISHDNGDDNDSAAVVIIIIFALLRKIQVY